MSDFVERDELLEDRRLITSLVGGNSSREGLCEGGMYSIGVLVVCRDEIVF
jgi:hypothetical protein